MAGKVRVIGESVLATSVERTLAGIHHDWNEPISVIVGWASTKELQDLYRRSEIPFILVEDAGGGDIAVGPLFKGKDSICLDCYLLRRRANGGRSCKPAKCITDPGLQRLREVLDANVGFHLDPFEHLLITNCGRLVRHSVFPIPACQDCWSRVSKSRQHRSTSLVSDRVGIVHEITALAGTPYPLHGAVSVGCRTDPFLGLTALNQGMATDYSLESAQMRAIGESVERYCASVPGKSIFASSDELEGDHLDVGDFDPRLKKQGRMTRPIHWVAAKNLITHAPVWVPAALVYIPFHNDFSEGPDSLWQTSVGLGAGESIEAAIQHGFAEIIERDSSLKAWRYRLPVKQAPIPNTNIDGLHLSIVPDKSGLSVVVALIEDVNPPFTSSGLGAGLSIKQTSEHAILEAVLTQTWLRNLLAAHNYKCPDVIRTMVDNAMAHALIPELRASRHRWLNGEGVGNSNLTRKLSWEKIVRAEPQACFVELTTPDVRKAGLFVVRVLIPGRVVQDDDYSLTRLGGDKTPHPFG